MKNELLDDVRRDGTDLRFIQNQTPEICLAAVRQNGYALKYVKEQSSEINIAAITQNGLALKYIEKQTPEICFLAVINNGKALKYCCDNMLNKNEHYIFEHKNIRKIYVNKINEEWLFSVGCQNNITKGEFIDRIHNTDGGLDENPHRQIYLDFLSNF